MNDNLVHENIPTLSTELKQKISKYHNIRGAQFQGWHKDGIVISTRFEQTSQLHYVRKPEGYRQQLTFYDEPILSSHTCPTEKNHNISMVFSKDTGGNEEYQLYTFDIEDHKLCHFTNKNSRNGSCIWSNCGNLIAFYSTQRNGKDTDIYVKNIKINEDAKLVLEVKGFWSPTDFKNDKILLKQHISAQESYLYILDLKTNELEKIPKIDSNNKETVAIGASSFSNSNEIYFTSNEGNEFKKLYSYSKGVFKILTKDINWNVTQFQLSEKDNSIFFVTNEDGISALYHQIDEKRKKLNIPLGLISRIDLNNDKIGITLSTPQMAADVFVYHVDSGELIRWTFSETGELKSENFVIPKLIHYESFDSLKIPAFYYKPKVETKEKLPVIILIHGGPESQILPIFMKTIQFFVLEFGIAVITPNVRGSTGYGKTYMNLDNVYKREDSVKDIGALIDWIGTQEELDSKKILIKGGSYGGYMTLATMIHFGSKICAGISTVGISNFITFLTNTKPYRVDLRRVEYGDERDPDVKKFLHKISPTTSAHKIDKPLFIIQGGNDPRVPVSEAEQMMEEVKKNGTPVWYLMAKNEGHGFRKKVNIEIQHLCEAMFIENFLK